MAQEQIDEALVFEEVEKELRSARAKWPAFNSAHEAYGVIREEFKEFEEHVFTNQKRRDLTAMRAELIQLSAMAARAAIEIATEERGRK